MFELFFYLFSFNILSSATVMTMTKSPIHAVMFLIYCFFSTACLWALFNSGYLAIILVLIYVGAVMVLFIFIIMMLNTKKNTTKTYLSSHIILVGILLFLAAWQVGGLLLVELPETDLTQHHTFKSLGLLMYEQYVVEVEIAAILLLCAMIAAIVLSIRSTARSLKQNINQQVQANPKTRLRMIQMSPEMNKKQDIKK